MKKCFWKTAVQRSLPCLFVCFRHIYLFSPFCQAQVCFYYNNLFQRHTQKNDNTMTYPGQILCFCLLLLPLYLNISTTFHLTPGKGKSLIAENLECWLWKDWKKMSFMAELGPLIDEVGKVVNVIKWMSFILNFWSQVFFCW